MATLSIRIDFGKGGRLGPGKVRLLELIEEHGSIAAAGRAMKMSYRRAWLLVDDMNRCFGDPVVVGQTGGSGGGGARLTNFGREVVARYRAVECAAATAAAGDLNALQAKASEQGDDARCPEMPSPPCR
jgi:molybdate transport system regulatory protein